MNRPPGACEHLLHGNKHLLHKIPDSSILKVTPTSSASDTWIAQLMLDVPSVSCTVPEINKWALNPSLSAHAQSAPLCRGNEEQTSHVKEGKKDRSAHLWISGAAHLALGLSCHLRDGL